MTRLAAESRDSSDYEGYSSGREIKKFAKSMLRTSIFVGSFQEKRFVEPINSYRDVIRVDESETDLIKNLMVVKRKIQTTLLKKPWVGITEPCTTTNSYCLWVELPEEVFGKYWYKVKTVELFENEVRLKLEILRPFKLESTPPHNTSNTSSNTSRTDDFNFSSYIEECKNQLRQQFIYFLTNILTLKNIVEGTTFMVLFLMATLTGLINLMQYFMDYSLKLMREFSYFIKVISPIINTFVVVCGKVIHGFYTTLFRLWKSPNPVYVNNYVIDPRQARYNPVYRRELLHTQNRGLPYRSSVEITPLD